MKISGKFGLLTFLLVLLPHSLLFAQEGNDKSPVVTRSIGRLVYQTPRGELVGADGIRVYLKEVANGPDLCLDGRVGDVTQTDENGYFDFTRVYEAANFLCDSSPDFKLVFSGSGFSYETPMVPDHPGGTIDWGTIRPTDERGNYGLHVDTTENRAIRWFGERGYAASHYFGFDTEGVPAHRSWPSIASTPGSWNTHYKYNGGFQFRYIGYEDRWNEMAIARLVAENFIHLNATFYIMDYCNGTCDGSTENCDFCEWCPETQTIAWHQGFAAWAASEIVGEYPVRYGDNPLTYESYETRADCAVTTQTQWETPGLFAAVLKDISDSTNENYNGYPDGWDAMSVGPNPILWVFANREMWNPWMFFDEFRNQYPDLCLELALTARNNGFIFDGTAPGVVTDLTSTSHTIGVANPDATVDLDWTAPADDCETAFQYSIVYSASAQLPDQTAEVRGATSWTSPVLAPGTWYFSIRSADATGNWNGSFDSVGPILIRNPIPANLTHVSQPGWTSLVTPRSSAGATSGNVVQPMTLVGETASTWWNASVGNQGDNPTGAGTGLWVQADGLGFYNIFDPVDHAASIPNLGPMATHEVLNLGPITVRGGRHTFGAYNDFTGLVPESNETDNYYAKQWIWTPLQLAVGESRFRFSPPSRVGGWDGAVSTLWFNADGINFPATGTGAGWWNALTVVADHHGVDYDARLHVASTGALNGFSSNVGFSGRPADCLDAVFANRNEAGNTTWDVGIIQASDVPSSSSFTVQHVTSTLEAFGLERAFSLGANVYMSLHEVQVTGDNTGPVSFVVRNTTSDAIFHLSWLDASFVTGGMDDYTNTAISDATGTARVDVVIPAAGYSCLVVYRDPKDGDADQLDMTIDIDVTPPDLVPDQPTGWAGAIVARPADDVAPGSVPDPVSLPGWATQTWLNIAVGNIGPTTAPAGFQVDLDIDGIEVAPLLSALEIPPLSGIDGINIGPFDVRGGRHSVAMRVDWPNAIEEISELNNHLARQWAWSPQVLSFGVNTAIPMPGDPFGSWEHLDWSDPAVVWPNADGYRTPDFDPGAAHGMWAGVAAMPGASSDVTLRLHTTLNDVNLSFGFPAAFSGFPIGEIDFCLMDFNYFNSTTVDVGLSGGLGTENTVMEVVTSTYLADQPAGNYGIFSLGSNEMLDLHEVDLVPGFLRVRLENLSGTSDLGFSIHPPEVGPMGRLDAIPDGAAWVNIPGGDEWIVAEIPTTGMYCIAVWKVHTAELPDVADYRLDFLEVSDVVQEVPVQATRLVGAHPNPFNPRTSIAFELSEGGQVRLEIYDLRGRLVNRLVDTAYGPGRHEVEWNGVDLHGQSVANGAYVARFQAGGVSRHQKLMLVK